MRRMIVVFIAMLLMCSCALADGNVASVTAGGSTKSYTSLHDALDAALNTVGVTSATITLLDDINFNTSDTWTSVPFDQSHKLTFNGNNKKITNLPGMMFNKTGSGGHHLIMSDVTFESPKAEVNGENAAVIMGYADSVNELNFTNVHIRNAYVKSNKYAGAFYGYGAGYNVQSDGPVFAHYKLTNCSVENSTIIGGGSTGALIGHATGNAWTKVVISDTVVSGNTITGEKSEKEGILIGTIGVAQKDQGKEGGVWVEATENNNKLTHNVQHVVGRIGSTGGTCYFTKGGSYTVNPILTSDPSTGTISPEASFVSFQRLDKTWTIGNPLTISFDANGGSGTMEFLTASTGETFTFPTCTFTGPDGKIFAGWKVGDHTYSVGDVIKVNTDLKVSAIWEEAQETQETRVNVDELDEVPKELKEEYSSVQEIKSALLSRMTVSGMTPTMDQTEFFDIELQFSSDGGKTWIKATKDNFPKGGITVELDYPKGTNRNGYRFSVAHMLTISMNGMKAGEIERPTVRTTEKKIVVTLNGLSPVAISWQKVENQPGANLPQTGDGSNPLMYIGMMLIALAGIGILMKHRK